MSDTTRPSYRPDAKFTAFMCVLALGVLGSWVMADPHANVPIVSEVICGVKGGTWTDGDVAWGIRAGCYR